jgi:hypothetical protein
VEYRTKETCYECDFHKPGFKTMKKAKITVYTWKTFGADTRLANADESVAENIPMVIKGPKPAIFSIA